jgi:curved DNA-binding protein
MEYKDYYTILGVSKDADETAVKKAFRSLARKYHPDANPDDPTAESKFKEINEAYEVLRDPDKRAKYDQLRRSYQRWQHAGGQPGSFDWSQWAGGAPGGMRVEYSGTGDLFSDFFQAIFGGMQGMGGQGYPGTLDDLLGGRMGGQRRMRGQDLSTEVTITLEEAYHGTTRLISKDGRRLQVKIPAGAHTGTRVRIAGEGASGRSEAEAGDLYIKVIVQPDPRFTREGDDLTVDVTLDLYTVVLGGEVEIPTMTGRVTLKINPGTQPGQLIRIRGKGMPRLRARKDDDTHGDLYVRINVDIPADLSAKEKALFRELASLRGQGFDRQQGD